MAVTCTGCGKSLNVKDELVGKSIRCPACRETFVARAAKGGGTTPARNSSASASKSRQATPKIHLSPAVILVICLLVGIPTLLAIWSFGPGAVQKEIAARESKINDEITDVVEWVLRVRTEGREKGFTDASGIKTAPAAPRVHAVTVLWSPLYLSMPDKVVFGGTSSEGAFQGFYHPQTGEVEVELEEGGTVLPSGIIMKRGRDKFSATGRTRDGKLTAEIEGKPALLKPPATRPAE